MTAIEPSFSTHASLADRILAVAERSGTSTFLRLLSAEGIPTELSYMDLIQQASLWAEIFKKHGLKPRQRVVLLVSHSIDSYAAFLGAIVSGLIPAMLPPPSPKLSNGRFIEMISALLPAISPDAVVVGTELRGLALNSLGVVFISAQEALGTPPTRELALASSGRGEDLAFLQYSSGTTGHRKGVKISHAACLKQVDLYSAAIGLGPSDSIVSWLPLYHDMGLLTCWMLPLLTGVSVTAMSPFDWIGRPSMLTRAIRAYRPSFCWLPNFAFPHLTRSIPDAELDSDDLSSVRAFVNCSEPIRQSAHEAFLAKFAKAGARPDQLATCYAMAEATFAITSSQPGEAPKTLSVDPACLGPGSAIQSGSVVLVSSGRPIGETTVRVVDGHGETVPDSMVGHLRVSSPTLTDGYLANAEATRNAFIGNELNTGDIGFIQGNELFVLGRADDTIIVAGRNVFPQDLEAVVDSIPGVIPGRSVALGVTDDREGTSHIVVIAETDQTDDRDGLERWISAELVSRLDVSPRVVRTIERGWLTKSTSGKISRRLNRERYLSELAPRVVVPTHPSSARDAPLVEFVRAAVASALKRECPADDDSLIMSGQLDSLALTTLLLELGERFGERTPMPNVVGFHQFDSVEAICRLLDEVERGFTAQSPQATVSAREVKLKGLTKLRGDLDLLILGSSTAYAIPSRIAGAMGMSAYNLSINLALIADIYCVTRLVLAGRSVRRMLIGLDVFSFKSKDAVFDVRMIGFPELTRYLAPEDQAALAKLGGTGTEESRRQRINMQRLVEWNPLLRYSFDERNGDLTLGDLDAQSRPAELWPDAINPQKHEMSMVFGDFTGLCPRQSSYLREIASFAGAMGIRIDFVVMPIHPELHAFLVETTSYPARRNDVLDLLHTLASDRIGVYDLPTPSAFGGDDGDFWDAYHIRAKNGGLLLRHVLSG